MIDTEPMDDNNDDVFNKYQFVIKLHEFCVDDSNSENEWFINGCFDLRYDLCLLVLLWVMM